MIQCQKKKKKKKKKGGYTKKKKAVTPKKKKILATRLLKSCISWMLYEKTKGVTKFLAVMGEKGSFERKREETNKQGNQV